MGKARELGGLTFNSQKVAVTAPNAAVVTLATLPSFDIATYVVTAGLKAGDPVNYHAVAIVSTQGGTAKITNLVTASLLSLSMSGMSVQATQNSGPTQTIHGFVTRLNAE
jgi:hypothetical protein